MTKSLYSRFPLKMFGLITVKPINFARDLISLILQVVKIQEIEKYLQKFKFTLTVTVKLPDA